jgi:hypothetical protein
MPPAWDRIDSQSPGAKDPAVLGKENLLSGGK